MSGINVTIDDTEVPSTPTRSDDPQVEEITDTISLSLPTEVIPTITPQSESTYTPTTRLITTTMARQEEWESNVNQPLQDRLNDLNDALDSTINTDSITPISILRSTRPNQSPIYIMLKTVIGMSTELIDILLTKTHVENLEDLMEYTAEQLIAHGTYAHHANRILRTLQYYRENGTIPQTVPTSMTPPPSQYDNSPYTIITPDKSSVDPTRNSSFFRTDTQEHEMLMVREGQLAEIPPFPMDWRKWSKWEALVRNSVGVNSWHEYIYSTKPIITPKQIATNESIFWRFISAVEGTEAEHVLTPLIPIDGDSPPGSGRTAYQALVTWMNADDSRNLRADRIDDELRALRTDGTPNSLSIAQYVNKFVLLLHDYNMTASISRQLNDDTATKLFVDHMLDKRYLSCIHRCQRYDLPLAEYIVQLRIAIAQNERFDLHSDTHVTVRRTPYTGPTTARKTNNARPRKTGYRIPEEAWHKLPYKIQREIRNERTPSKKQAIYETHQNIGNGEAHRPPLPTHDSDITLVTSNKVAANTETAITKNSSTPNWANTPKRSVRRFSVQAIHTRINKNMESLAERQTDVNASWPVVDTSRLEPTDQVQNPLHAHVVDLSLRAASVVRRAPWTPDDDRGEPELAHEKRKDKPDENDITIRRTTLHRLVDAPAYALIDSGADACTVQQGWEITHIYEHENYTVGSYILDQQS
jgi:hypothetical protein